MCPYRFTPIWTHKLHNFGLSKCNLQLFWALKPHPLLECALQHTLSSPMCLDLRCWPYSTSDMGWGCNICMQYLYMKIPSVRVAYWRNLDYILYQWVEKFSSCICLCQFASRQISAEPCQDIWICTSRVLRICSKSSNQHQILIECNT